MIPSIGFCDGAIVKPYLHLVPGSSSMYVSDYPSEGATY